MNTTTHTFTAPQLVSASTRFATAIGVAAIAALTWIGTAQASHEAVETCAEAFARSTVQTATLPTVIVIGHREANDATDVVKLAAKSAAQPV